jgi:Bacterial regulatory proteins, luxR family
MAGITERDFGALHGLLDVDHIDDSGPGMPWRLMANLQELFHSDVARRMGLSEGTVRTHLNHMYERLGVSS